MPHRTTQAPDRALAPKEVARLLGVCGKTLRRLVASGKFPPPTRYSRKLLRWPASTVQAHIRQQLAGPEAG